MHKRETDSYQAVLTQFLRYTNLNLRPINGHFIYIYSEIYIYIYI